MLLKLKNNNQMKLPLFLKVLNSPFKSFKLKFYFGKTAIGVPYFFPRRWIPLTKDEVLEKAFEASKDPRKISKSFSDWVDYYEGMLKPVRKKVGFDFLDLGWKTKFDSYRFEFAPRISFVFYGYQIAIIAVVDHTDQYWESFLAYHFETDKTLNKKDRIKDCIKNFPCTWTRLSKDSPDVTTNYYNLILKRKYLKHK